MCTHMYIYIYISCASRKRPRLGNRRSFSTANLRTKILDFIGFDSSIILMLWGGTLLSIGDIP